MTKDMFPINKLLPSDMRSGYFRTSKVIYETAEIEQWNASDNAWLCQKPGSRSAQLNGLNPNTPTEEIKKDSCAQGKYIKT
jgi:hypothetical protein